MRVVWTWIVPLIVVAGIVIGVSYFQSGLFHPAAQNTVVAQQQAWVPVQHPPGSQGQVLEVKEFGAWHLACLKTAQQPAVPKVGFIQNFGTGTAAAQAGKPKPCRVSIMMRDPATPRQMMIMSFRYMYGFDAPEMAVIYTSFDKPHVVYDQTGKVHDLTKKDKWKGGFHRDFKQGPGGLKPVVQTQNIPKVVVQLGQKRFEIPTMACIKAHCAARQMNVDTAAIGPVSSLNVQLPGAPHSQPRSVDVPVSGLESALKELGRLSAS